jgi:hypothetical protein
MHDKISLSTNGAASADTGPRESDINAILLAADKHIPNTYPTPQKASQQYPARIQLRATQEILQAIRYQEKDVHPSHPACAKRGRTRDICSLITQKLGAERQLWRRRPPRLHRTSSAEHGGRGSAL